MVEREGNTVQNYLEQQLLLHLILRSKGNTFYKWSMGRNQTIKSTKIKEQRDKLQKIDVKKKFMHNSYTKGLDGDKWRNKLTQTNL